MEFRNLQKLIGQSLEYGEKGAAKRRAELANYAELLQELKNQGALGIAESRQEFERPEQAARITQYGAETEGTRLDTEGERFYQGLARQYGPTSIRQNLGIPEPESRANWEFSDGYKGYGAETGEADAIGPGDVSLPGLTPKTDISSVTPRFQIGPVPWALNLRRRRDRKERTARPFGRY